jgi:pimeloyl-ACP methyl ester carboxylesterase/CRP-like cAMP-binding protein
LSTLRVGNQLINFYEEGRRDRQLVLLIHGWSSSAYAMSPLMALLSQRYWCIAVDLPGYGNSPRMKNEVTIEQYANVLASFVESLYDGPVILVGHSMGGMISITMAEKFPELITRMILISPTVTGKLSTYINLIVSPITKLEQFSSTRFISRFVERISSTVVDRIMRPASFAARTGITSEDYNRLKTDARRSDQGIVRAECFDAMRANNLSGRLAGIQTPTLVVWGAEDNTVPLSDAGIIADEWPMADLRIMPRAGHWPQFERPEDTRRMIANFLGLQFTFGNRYTPVADDELEKSKDVATFLANSDIGNGLLDTHRERLAERLIQKSWEPGAIIAEIRELGTDLYLIQDGTVEVWYDPDRPGEPDGNFRKMATLRPGQISGEMALFDEGLRSARLLAGKAGATVLTLDRQVTLDLISDNPELGSKLLWNMGRALAHRVRFIQWQFRRASNKQTDRSATRPSLTSYNGKLSRNQKRPPPS